MTEYMVRLPESFSYVGQFEAGKSLRRDVAAVLAMVGEIAWPGRWQSPTMLMSKIYEHYTGTVDSSGNTRALTRDNMLDWLHTLNIGFIDMAPLIGGDMSALRAEMEAQNRQSVCQIITVGDESQLRYAANRNDKLHNWLSVSDAGQHHTFLRVGYDDGQNIGYYAEPAASSAFPSPLPMLWDDVVAAQIFSVIAIMPFNVPAPPAGFSFQSGQWPTPPPKIDTESASARIDVVTQALQAALAALQATKNDLGK